MKRGFLAVAIVVYIAAGVATGWALGSRRAEGHLPAIALAHQLEKVGLCAGALTSLEAEKSDKARLVLEQWMASSLSEADRLLSAGASIEQAIPNLREGVRRAFVYTERENVSPSLRTQADDVLRRLDALRGRDAS